MASKKCNISTVLSLVGDWVLASTKNSLGEGDIYSLRWISKHPPPSKEEIKKKKVFSSAVRKLGVFFKFSSLLGGGHVEIWFECVCFFASNLELVLSSSEGQLSDSVLPCLLLLHCQVKWCKSTQIALKLRKNKHNDTRQQYLHYINNFYRF